MKLSMTNKISRALLSVLSASVLLSSFATPLAGRVAAAPVTAAPRITFTFDDGLLSTYTQAAPTLAKYGYKGVVYTTSGCIGTTGTCPAEPTHDYMTWADVNALKNTYGWEIAAHTVNHPLLASTDPDSQPIALTPSQVAAELVNSRAAIKLNTGSEALNFATPYGDWTPPVLANIAKYQASHRGFADNIDQNADGIIEHGNTYPYNDYLLYDLPVQAGVTVAKVQSYIDQTIANNQWLILTFHDIKVAASTNPDDYEYSTAELDAIAAYIKAKQATVPALQVVDINGGLVNNTGNLLANASFNTAISTNIADTTAWSTDAPANVKQDTASKGSYPDATNSVLLTGSAANTHLFSPRVAVDPAKAYVIKNYLNVAKMTVAVGHEIAFYADEYDVSGNYMLSRYLRSEVGNAGNAVGAWTEKLNFTYTPTAGAKFARLQIVDTANSGAEVYLDNVEWFAQDGSTGGTPVVTGKPGDANNDLLIDGIDLDLVLRNWGKTAQTLGQGNVSKDTAGVIDGIDLDLVLRNWGK